MRKRESTFRRAFLDSRLRGNDPFDPLRSLRAGQGAFFNGLLSVVVKLIILRFASCAWRVRAKLSS